MSKDYKKYANKGVKRNKKPLQNLIYKVTFSTAEFPLRNQEFLEQCKYKDEGYMILSWCYQKEKLWFWHGLITKERLIKLIGEKQWAKFCGEGKREFIIQRREDGKNL